ncbi:MAG: MFS transporter [Gammaproteobacteria bacterium]|nr:MFS transporter [Gammaproteobacteria bacterium]
MSTTPVSSSEAGIRLLTALRVFVPFAAGYFFSYMVRNVNAVIAPDLSTDLGVGAASLGLLTSVYFLTFAGFQLPLGILLDRYGPRRVNAVLLMLAAAGSAVIAFSPSFAGVLLGRALIGVGVSAALMASLKATTLWFSSERLPLVNACIMTAGGLGALCATRPVEAMLAFTDWRGVFQIFALLAAVAAVLVWTMVPRRAQELGRESPPAFADLVAGLLSIYRSAAFWRIAPAATALHAALLSMQGLWAGPWMSDVAGLDRDTVAAHLFFVALSLVAGFFLSGALAERLQRIGIRTLDTAIGCAIVFMLFQLALVLELPVPGLLLWCGFACFGASGILFFTHLSQIWPPALAGRVVTALNLLVFGGAFAAQWGIGAIIELTAVAGDSGAGQGYTPLGYGLAFGSVLLLQAICFVWLVWRPAVPAPSARSEGQV